MIGQYTPMWIRSVWIKNLDPNPFSPNNVPLGVILDNFKLVLFVMNLALTIIIIVFYQSKPENYPTISQQYYRSKMYEPHLDVKYLQQYKEFKIYALIAGFIMAAVNTGINIPQNFLFVEAQSKQFVEDVLVIWCPLL